MNRSPHCPGELHLCDSLLVAGFGGNEIKERAAKRMPTVYFGDQVKDRIRCYIGLLMLIVVPLRLLYLADYPRMGSLVKKVWADSNLSHRAPGVGCARCAAVLRTWTAFERQFWNDLEPDLNRVCLMLPDDLA